MKDAPHLSCTLVNDCVTPRCVSSMLPGSLDLLLLFAAPFVTAALNMDVEKCAKLGDDITNMMVF